MGQARCDPRAGRRRRPAVRARGVARSAVGLHGLRSVHAVDVPRRLRLSLRRPAVRPLLRSAGRSVYGRVPPSQLLHASQRLRARACAEMTGAHFFPLLLVAALLGACSTPPRWARADASPEQADRDEVDCQRQAAREVSTLAGGFYGPNYAPYAYGPYNRRISRPDPAQRLSRARRGSTHRPLHARQGLSAPMTRAGALVLATMRPDFSPAQAV